ncbi:MAG: hypothetical protein R3A79_18560 [Nannocystaceae bacterium]
MRNSPHLRSTVPVVSAKTHEVLIHRFAGLPSDAHAFTEALRGLASEAKLRGLPALLLHPTGDVLAVADNGGQLRTWLPVHVEFEEDEELELAYEGDGWFEARGVTYYVHRARPYVLLRHGRLAITEVDTLPGDARAIPTQQLDAFAFAAAEAIEHYDTARRGEG